MSTTPSDPSQSVLFTGGFDGVDRSDQILRYSPSQDKWTTLGRMKNALSAHGLSVINIDTSDCQ
jgi:hypothetical protein